MAFRVFGDGDKVFDIHAGGVDHIAVHHENEIAQSEAAYGVPLAKYWLHNEFLLINGGRMGKSLGNAYTLDDIEEKDVDPLAYRYFALGAHYRSKLNFTWEALSQAEQALHRLHALLREWGEDEGDVSSDAMTRFREALEDDLNAPKALAVLWEVARGAVPAQDKRATLLAMDEVLGLGLSEIKEEQIVIPDDIQAMAEERQAAKLAKDWPLADQKRAELLSRGWEIQDTKDGFHLKLAKNHH